MRLCLHLHLHLRDSHSVVLEKAMEQHEKKKEEEELEEQDDDALRGALQTIE